MEFSTKIMYPIRIHNVKKEELGLHPYYSDESLVQIVETYEVGSMAFYYLISFPV